MRIIVAGGRDFAYYSLLEDELNFFRDTISSRATIISGGANGADRLGERYARQSNFNLKVFPADWNKYGKSAGYRRNAEMADYSEALIAFWDGESKGTKHMIDLALSKGLLVKVVKY
jgi:hypothetical protein